MDGHLLLFLWGLYQLPFHQTHICTYSTIWETEFVDRETDPTGLAQTPVTRKRKRTRWAKCACEITCNVPKQLIECSEYCFSIRSSSALQCSAIWMLSDVMRLIKASGVSGGNNITGCLVPCNLNYPWYGIPSKAPCCAAIQRVTAKYRLAGQLHLWLRVIFTPYSGGGEGIQWQVFSSLQHIFLPLLSKRR